MNMQHIMCGPRREDTQDISMGPYKLMHFLPKVGPHWFFRCTGPICKWVLPTTTTKYTTWAPMHACETQHVTNATSTVRACGLFVFSPSSIRLAFGAVLSLHPPFPTSPGDFLGPTTCILCHLREPGPCWTPRTLDCDPSTSSAVVPLVGTYALALFTALFWDAPVSCIWKWCRV